MKWYEKYINDNMTFVLEAEYLYSYDEDEVDSTVCQMGYDLFSKDGCIASSVSSNLVNFDMQGSAVNLFDEYHIKYIAENNNSYYNFEKDCGSIIDNIEYINKIASEDGYSYSVQAIIKFKDEELVA